MSTSQEVGHGRKRHSIFAIAPTLYLCPIFMRNPDKWKPTRVVRDPRTGGFMTNRKSIYGGSLYIAELQHAKYLPLIQEHISGHVLDIGCGPVPYHEVYGARTTASTCVDSSSKP